MKKNIISVALATACAFSLMSTANAADGLIDFTGSVVGNTCKINGGTGQNFTVNLPPVSAATLATAGSWAGRTPFQIKLTDCTPATGKVHALFELGPTINTTTGRLIVDAGGAEKVEIGLLNSAFQPIVAGAADGSQNTEILDIDNGNATMNFVAQYESLGGAKPGAANSRVHYTIIYQ